MTMHFPCPLPNESEVPNDIRRFEMYLSIDHSLSAFGPKGPNIANHVKRIG